ncbi:hypothetical protein SOASR015_34930 [Pectobacterium carotovorum subsp. carotovorum]|nr:hypothetical protein SOASR015_34930 [Pectobacterium carotovorum subsp. carotovorum]GLX58054.1 hypothetical protein Pcaca02_33630 [Pectobacterium carotovorum subsp. carotovorum]
MDANDASREDSCRCGQTYSEIGAINEIMKTFPVTSLTRVLLINNGEERIASEVKSNSTKKRLKTGQSID